MGKAKAADKGQKITEIDGQITLQRKERQTDNRNAGGNDIIFRWFYFVKKPVQKRNNNDVQRRDKRILAGGRKLQSIGLEIIADKQQKA